MPKGAGSKKRKPYGYWRDEKNIERELRVWIEEYGKLPSQNELEKNNRSDLVHAIYRHGGFPSWRRRFGFSSTQKPRGYWNDEKNIEREIREWIEKHGEFPAEQKLRDENRKDLLTAIAKYGGFPRWRQRFKHPELRKPSGYWNSEENIEREIQEWVKKHKKFPKVDKLKLQGRMDLANAIRKHGGFNFWRQRLKFSASRKPSGYWDNEQNIEREIQEWIKKHKKFPTTNELKKGSETTLAIAISAHGGFDHWRQRFGFPSIQKSPGYWNDEKNIEREIREWIEKHGEFPTEKTLRDENRSDLFNAINKRCGFPVWRQRFGFPAARKPNGYWDDENNLELEISAWIEKYGEFPRLTKLQKEGRSDLIDAIQNHGGLPAWRARMGYGPITGELLKLNAEPLVRVLFALQKAKPDLKSDEFLAAVKNRWAEKQLKEAIQAFTDKNKLEAFRKLLDI